MEHSTSQTKALTDRPLKEVIEEAAREAAEKVRDRNKRMGWPLVVSETKPTSTVASPHYKTSLQNAGAAASPESASSSKSSKR